MIRHLHGDCREVLKTLPDNSVHCVVTSPPYWGLRDYQCSGQIGLEPTPDAYVAEMTGVFREVRRVLRDDGVCWLNLGSSYASSTSKKTQFRPPKHVPACGSDGKESQDSQDADRAYPDSCDELQDENRPHHGCNARSGQSVEQDAPLPLQIIRDNGRLDCASLPLDVSLPDDHSSKQPSFSQRFQENASIQFREAECQSCGQTLPTSILESVHTGLNKPDMSSPLPILTVRTEGKESFYSACHRSDCKGIGKCGLCWCSLTIPSLNIKPKDLISIPQLVAFALQSDGWYLRSEITWCKKAPMPESVTDRPTSATEKIFLLTKSARYFYDAEAVREENSDPYRTKFTSGAKSVKYRGDSNGTDFNIIPANGRNLRNFWLLGPDPYPGAHFATMPRRIPEIAIMAGTSEAGCCSECGKPWERVVETNRVKHSHTPGKGGRQTYTPESWGKSCFTTGLVPVTHTLGFRPTCSCNAPARPCTVLDPFGGSGTTGMVAEQLGRDAILIELNPDYIALQRQRVRQPSLLMAA